MVIIHTALIQRKGGNSKRPGKSKKPILFIIFFSSFQLFVFLPTSNAQEKIKGFSIPGIVQHNFTSKINAVPYQLSVALPFGYSQNDTFRYPVMYIMDGDPNLPLAALIQRNMTYDKELPNVIIVGLGYQVVDFMATVPYRTLDYTPTRVARSDSEMTANHHIKMVSGGASNFLRVLSEEIIPFIEETYKTNNDRLLAGHSFGGLFAAYTLFHKPELFDRYLISSPSFYWGNFEVLNEEDQFYMQGHKDLSKKVFISAGSLEPDEMVPDVELLVNKLRSRKYKGLTLTERIFDDETHLSVIPFAISRGLRVLYNPGNQGK